MWVATFLVLYIVIGSALCIAVHTMRFGFNFNQALLAFFLVINLLICIWYLLYILYTLYYEL